MLLIEPLGSFSGVLSEIHTFSFKKMHLKTSSAKWRPSCLGLNVLKTKASQGNISESRTSSNAFLCFFPYMQSMCTRSWNARLIKINQILHLKLQYNLNKIICKNNYSSLISLSDICWGFLGIFTCTQAWLCRLKQILWILEYVYRYAELCCNMAKHMGQNANAVHKDSFISSHTWCYAHL